MNTDYDAQPWVKQTLFAAGLYNLLWGMLCVLAPSALLTFVGITSTPVVSQLWQCIGMIVGVYGVGYIIASYDPYRHWAVTLVGLLGKVFGPIGFLVAVANGSLPSRMGWIILANDLIWWIPFAVILWSTIRSYHAVGSAYDLPEADDPLRDIKANTGCYLNDLTNETPQLVVFLRHSGCTFCREALTDISTQRKQIEESGTGIAFVHLGNESEDDDKFFEGYGLQDLPRFSDPECRLYRLFGLDLGGFSQLFGLRVWIRGFVAGFLHSHGRGAVSGNSFQMPGVYLYHRGQILGGFRHDHASDRPDYLALAQQVQQSRQPVTA
ncbi:MAG: SelL-related redox protein [Fuerstiella sp.]|nr:SelL-related redox protein [Fuerstiella sp.]